MRNGKCPVCNEGFGMARQAGLKRWYFHTDLPDAKEYCMETAANDDGEIVERELTQTYPEELRELLGVV